MHSNRLRFTSSIQVLEIKKDVKMQERYGQDGGLDMTSFLEDSPKATEKGCVLMYSPVCLREKIITLN